MIEGTNQLLDHGVHQMNDERIEDKKEILPIRKANEMVILSVI